MTPNNNKSPPRTYPGARQDTYEDTSAEQLTTLAGIEQAVQPNAETRA